MWTVSATHSVRMICENLTCSFKKKTGRVWSYIQVILSNADVPTKCIHCNSRDIKLEAIGDGKTLTKVV